MTSEDLLRERIYFLEEVITHLLERLNELELEFRDYVVEN
jgi:hypothetical protein